MRRLRFLVAAALVLGGCHTTEVVVVIRSDLPSFGSALIDIYASPRPIARAEPADLETPCGCVGSGALCTPQPLELGLLPNDVDRAHVFSVEARGFVGPVCADALVAQRARISFVRDQKVVLHLDLLQDCVGIRCDDPGTTCKHGMCVSDSQEPLEPFDPNQLAGLDGSTRPPDLFGADLTYRDIAMPPPRDLAESAPDLSAAVDDLTMSPDRDDLSNPTLHDGAMASPDLSDAAMTSLGDGCFLGGTPVLTRGGWRAIETLEPGGIVEALDAERAAGATPSLARIVDTVGHLVDEVVDLHFGGVTVSATPDHPLFVAARGWTPAGELRPGDGVLDHDGGLQRVTSIDRRRGSFAVYNLHLGEQHAYFVSPLGLAAHNNSGS